MRKLFVFLLVLFPLQLRAQPYEHAAGIRAGYSSGFTYKGFFLHRLSAIEAAAMYSRNGFQVSAMYEMHHELDRKGRFYVFAGAGLAGGTWEDEFSAGICATGGVMYCLRKIPLNFGADWRPALNAYQSFDYELLDFGLSIRYRFSL